MKARNGKGLHDLMSQLTRRRLDENVTVQQIATAMGISAATVWAWEAGRRQPNLWQANQYGKLVRAELTLLATCGPDEVEG